MVVHSTELEGVLVLEPKIHYDARGYFLESYNEKAFADAGITERFVQDNQSYSKKGVLRGLHYQVEKEQAKLIRVLQGTIFDVVVDLRKESRTHGKWAGMQLNSAEMKAIWIPKGFAHGFYTLSEYAEVCYKVTNFYSPETERTLLWNDPQLGIHWPLQEEPLLSEKDRLGHPLIALERA